MTQSCQSLWNITFLLVVFMGCGQRDYTGEQRFPVSGKVSYDAEPIDFGSITFLPSTGQRVSGGLIENGSYAVSEAQGPHAGKHRVEIRWNKHTGRQKRDPDSGEMFDERKEALPPRFHAESELTAEVSASQTKFDFDLKSK